MVVRAAPPTSTADPETKLEPVTVMDAGVAPTRKLLGLTAMGPGTGLFTGNETAKDVPPPGEALTAVRARRPAAARSAVVRETLSWLELTKAVVRAVPFTLITVVGTKPVPATATADAAVPTPSAAGESAVMAGEGLSTSRLTAALPALLKSPFTATMESMAPTASWLAGIDAVTWLVLTKVVGSTFWPTLITVFAVKPVPFTVSAVALAPAVTFVGEMELTVGGWAVGCVEVLPDPEPPHPASKPDTAKHTQA